MAQKTDMGQATGAPGTGASLADLEGMAAQVDAQHNGTLPDGQPIADQPAPVDYGQEAAATVDTFAALIVGYCPAAAELWTQEKKAHVAMALAPVMEKYAFTLGALPCELTLIIVAGPLLYQTSRLVAAQMAAAKTPAKAAARSTEAATPAPEGDPKAMPKNTPELARHPQTALYK